MLDARIALLSLLCLAEGTVALSSARGWPGLWAKALLFFCCPDWVAH